MTRLSVNINKIATLRNARGGNNPNVLTVARDAERFGAQGITVHPRPDERHIRYQDVRDLKPLVTTEFNIEGNPIDSFTQLVLEVVPTQVTLVPDGHDQLTSNHGWDTIENKTFLTDICRTFKEAGIRTSIFVDADPKMLQCAKKVAESSKQRVLSGLICTGDQFISDKATQAEIKTRFPEALACEMESAAIAHTCLLRHVPFLSVRVVSDTPGNTDDHQQQWSDFLTFMSDKSFHFVKSFLEQL